MMIVLAVAAGGAIGAVGRYFVIGWAETLLAAWLGAGFSYGTMVVNVIGSFLLGVLVEVMALSLSISPEIRSLLVVGVLSGFTTFSAFSLDTVLLLERGEIGRALVYVLLSVGLSIGALFLGLRLIRLALS
jgi:CrcB protein